MHSILWGEFHCQQFAISDIIIFVQQGISSRKYMETF